MWMPLFANWSKPKQNSNVVLKSCSTNHKLCHRQIFNMNETASEIENAFLKLFFFLIRTILLPGIGDLLLPKATGNQYSQYITKMSCEAETKGIQFFPFCASQRTFQLVFSTSPIIGEVTEILLKERENQIWEWYKSLDFSALISQSILFWKTWIDYVLDPVYEDLCIP